MKPPPDPIAVDKQLTPWSNGKLSPEQQFMHGGLTMSENSFNSVNPETGTKTYSGPSTITPGNHTGMPPRTEAYELTDERGHIQASSLGGSNSRDNIVPQSKDLNHGAYYQMEGAERSVLKSGGKIDSEKSAFVSNQSGGRPDAFMVNDNVTHANGNVQSVHLSFTNLTNAEQESLNQSLNAHTDMLNSPNPADALRESMSEADYAQLMEETDPYLPSIKDMYDPSNIFSTPSLNTTESAGSMNISVSGNTEAPSTEITESGNAVWDFDLSDVTGMDSITGDIGNAEPGEAEAGGTESTVDGADSGPADAGADASWDE